MRSSSRPAPCGTGQVGWGAAYRVLLRVIQLGSPQPALDLGERVGWDEPLGSPGAPPLLALTEKAHAIPTRQTNTSTLLMAAFSGNTETRRGLAFQLESTNTTPNQPHVCVHVG